MKILKDRRFAALVLVAVTVVSVLLNVKGSLKKQTDKIEKGFYNGVYLKDDGYTSSAIQTHLDNRINASLGLITLASDFPELSEETDKLRDARKSLLNAESISEKYAANYLLERFWNALYNDLGGCELSVSDRKAAEDYAKTLSGAQSAIESNPYNDTVSEFYGTILKGFPVNILRHVVSAEEPDFFAFKEI